MTPDFTITLEVRERKDFRPSDYGKMSMELWLALQNYPQTNPPKWYETLKWGAGLGVEAQMLKVLKDSGIVDPEYNQAEHGRLSMERNDIHINGYTDARTKEGEPIEIKSINNKNAFDIRDYDNGTPRENYVGQLAMYCDALGTDRGWLFAATVDGLHTYWFPCERVRSRLFRCGRVEVDLDAEYSRFQAVRVLIDTDEEPEWTEKIYKYDIETLDWSKISKAAIQSARMNRAVVGDWQIKYSPWKDFFIKKQGTTPGYTDAELARVRELTKRFSSK